MLSPKWHVDDVVYLRESAETGFLEAMKIHDFRYDSASQLFFYRFRISPRPPATMTMGDRITQKFGYDFELAEPELMDACEAMGAQVYALKTRLDMAKHKHASAGDDIRTTSPRYEPGETAYVRRSAVIGMLEMAKIISLRFDRGSMQYVYKFSISAKISPYEIAESDLIGYKSALDVQIAFLELQHSEALTKYQQLCGGTEISGG